MQAMDPGSAQAPVFWVEREPSTDLSSGENQAFRGVSSALPVMTNSTHDSLIVVAPTPPPVHGVAVFTSLLVSSLRRLGLLSAHVDTRDPRSLENIGLLDFENVRLGLVHLLALYRQLRANPRAAVYVAASQAALPFFRDSLFVGLARLMGRRVYVHIHGGAFGRFYESAGPLTRWVVRFTFRRVTRVWVLTGSLKPMVAGLVAPEQVQVLENVVEDISLSRAARRPEPDQSVRNQSNGEHGPLRLLYLSNLLPDKGYLDLLDALARFDPQRDPSVEVRFVGWVSPTVASEFQRRREMLPGNVRVWLRRTRSGAEKAAEFRWATAFALPTRHLEGQPLVLLEAMAAGLPIVATGQGGIPETTRDGQEALLIDAGDLEALGDAIRRLARDAPLRNALGRSSRQRYVSRYQTKRLDRDLCELLSRGDPPRRDSHVD